MDKEQELADELIMANIFKSVHSKIDIRNFSHIGYAYLTVVIDRDGAPYQKILFLNYTATKRYGSFLEDIKRLLPLHCTHIKNGLMTFHKDKVCPCGYKYNQS